MIPFEPIVRLFYSFPFAGLIAFLVLQLGVVNNMSLSRFVRFNSMQVRTLYSRTQLTRLSPCDVAHPAALS